MYMSNSPDGYLMLSTDIIAMGKGGVYLHAAHGPSEHFAIIESMMKEMDAVVTRYGDRYGWFQEIEGRVCWRSSPKGKHE
jgi:hypothetical protein